MSQRASRSSQGALGSSEGSSRGALGELLGSSRGALGDLSRRQTLYFQKCMVFHLFYNKNGNLSDVRTGRAFGGGEHNTLVSSKLCVRELRGPSDIGEEHRWA